jgi:5-oxopent-3-ene-1,2,5-tricarboxylate decarboxylase/2-hydroxyhepta-2,4-diene-1,7-dioate isomerase
MSLCAVAFEIAPFRFSGTVLGVLHNDRASLAAIGPAIDAAPYRGAPKAPVLYVKPRNTQVGPGAVAEVPAGGELEVGAAIGLVIGRTACAVREADALAHVAGFVIVADLSVPQASWYRPQIAAKARDRSCVIGPRVVARPDVGDPAAIGLRVRVDGVLVHARSHVDWARMPARLLADVTEFMTLAPGDVVLAGVAHAAPCVRAGQSVSIEADGLGELRFTATTPGRA